MTALERLTPLVEQGKQLREQILRTITEIVLTNDNSLQSIHGTTYPLHVDDYADSRLLELFVTPKKVLVLEMGDFEDNLQIGPAFYMPAEKVRVDELLEIVRLIIADYERCGHPIKS